MRCGFFDKCFCSVSTIVLKDRLDGLAGAAKLRSNPYVLLPIKVAEHSFRARFRWCNSARTQGLQNKHAVIYKVAEHSFRARFCWRDSARAKGLQKQKCRQ